MLHIDFSNKRTLTSSVVYKQNEIDNKGVSAKLINVDIDENSSGAAFWTSPSGETMQTEFVINDEIGTFKVPTSEIGTWILELVVYNDGRPKSADYNFEILKSYSVDPSNAEIELLIETIVRHDHTYTQNENIRIENENTRIIEHGDRMSKSDVATANAIQATHNADQATANANEATQRANDSAENAEHAIENMVQLTEATVTATANANAQAEHAKMQGDYAKTQGDHAKQATIDASNATSLTNQTIQQANTATTNAVNATNNAVTATERANTATQQANTATANANTATTSTIQATTEAGSATTNAIQATSNAQTATTNANTATANANNATVNANTATTNANTATTKANQAVTSVQNAIAAGTVDLELKQARTDATGFEHANLKTRLDEDFKKLASKIPTDVAMNGYESVTTNDTLSGEVSSTVLTGQTLVNVVGTGLNLKFVKASTKYTVLVTSSVAETATLSHDTTTIFSSFKQGVNIATYTTTSAPSLALTRTGSAVLTNLIILEGDHTDKPLEFFEGLKSAELSEVTSHGVNLVDVEKCEPNGKYLLQDGVNFYSGLHGYRKTTNYLKVLPNTTYFNVGNAGGSIYVFEYSEKGFCINDDLTKYRTIASKKSFTTKQNTKYVRMFTQADTIDVLDSLYLGTPTTYVQYTSSKTTLSEPITLRSLPNGVADTYDVDTGVLTRRCGEVVLDGSESGWYREREIESFVEFQAPIGGMYSGVSLPFCDMFTPSTTGNFERISGYNKAVYIVIAKSKLTTPDVAGFKAWLTANPTTVVYQLTTPTTEVIENNGQLRSYDSQTTVFANSIVPVKISGNIPVNYASTLAKTMQSLDELQAENRELKNTIEELSNDVNQIHAFMYAMMNNANTLEEE